MREEFRERLEIDTLAQRYDPDKLEELLDNIVEMYCCPRQTQYVGKQPQTTKAIRLRLDKLTSQHVEYIFDVMSNTTQPIKNIMAYLRTTILNAPTTMEHYYQAQGNWLTAQRASSFKSASTLDTLTVANCLPQLAARQTDDILTRRLFQLYFSRTFQQISFSGYILAFFVGYQLEGQFFGSLKFRGFSI